MQEKEVQLQLNCFPVDFNWRKIVLRDFMQFILLYNFA